MFQVREAQEDELDRLGQKEVIERLAGA